jgi:alpha-galactosidase
LFRVPMNGQFGMSSRVFDSSPELVLRAAQNVALYKRLRPVIRRADVYHLTPQPSHNDPAGWMAIQYVTPDRRCRVVLAYRLGQSAAEQVFRLRGLDGGIKYRVRIDGGGEVMRTGAELAAWGE